MFMLVAGLALSGPVVAPRMEEMAPMGQDARTDAYTSVRMVEAGWSRLTARRRTLPSPPPGVPAAGEKLRCTVHVDVDPKGKPSSVVPGACDEAIRGATVAAAWEWRFVPTWEDGQPVPAETELSAVVAGRRRSKKGTR